MISETPATLDLLLRVIRELRRGYDAGAAEVGLTMSRARVITTLATMEGATQAELASALGIESPTLKRQIDALEKLGFIEKRGMKDDARKRALHLTEQGRCSSVTRFVLSIRTELLAGVAPDDLEALNRALAQIAENATRLSGK